jgi:hypothetical protein
VRKALLALLLMVVPASADPVNIIPLVVIENDDGGYLLDYWDHYKKLKAARQPIIILRQRLTSRDFVPWRFSDACPPSAWMDLSCRRPRNLHISGPHAGVAI